MKYLAFLGILLVSSSCHAFTLAGKIQCYSGGVKYLDIDAASYSWSTDGNILLAEEHPSGMNHEVRADCFVQKP